MAQELVSTGLAVSYFYNFVKRLFDNLTGNSYVKAENMNYPFSYVSVSLEVILPNRINQDEIEKCRNYIESLDEVRLPIDIGRDMSFFVEDIEAKSKLILDFPTIIASIIEYLRLDSENMRGFIDIDTDSITWKDRESEELKKFKEVLEFLIDSYDATRGKVQVKFFNSSP